VTEYLARFRTAFEAVSRGDLERAAEMVSPEFVIDDHTVPEDTTAERGLGAFRATLSRLGEAFDDYRVELLDVTDLGDGRLLAVIRTSGTGKGSGIEIDGEVGQVVTVESGLMMRADVYPSPDEARRAAGLES
jgi:ketosteroid isomerase-like protein